MAEWGAAPVMREPPIPPQQYGGGAAQTSSGQSTLATVGNAPPQTQPAQQGPPVYHTSRGPMALDKIKEFLDTNILHKSHLGDDALKALDNPQATQYPASQGAWGAPKQQASAAAATPGGTTWGSKVK